VLLGAEFGLREVAYRWLAFLILGTALTRVVFMDLWSAHIFWPNLIPIVLVLALQYLTKLFPAHYRIESMWSNSMILVGGGSLWLFISRWVILENQGNHFFLTASWAALALIIFAMGLTLRERVYRWLGLGILGCSLARVFIFDIWKLTMGYRIVSFLALGISLLALGFFYNRFQEKIREWI
jgi:hypothetical protein